MNTLLYLINKAKYLLILIVGFVVAACIHKYFFPDQYISYSDCLSVLVLWITAVLLWFYADETKFLREEATKQRQQTIKQINLSVRPLVVLEINERNIEGWILHNIGNGPALNTRVYRSNISEGEFSHDFKTLAIDPNMLPVICLEKDGTYSNIYSSLDWYNGTHEIFRQMHIDRDKETWPLEFYIWVYFEDLIGGKFVLRHHTRVRDFYMSQNLRTNKKDQINFNFNIIDTKFDPKQNAKL